MYLPSVGQDLSQLSVDILEKSKTDAENADRSKDVVDAVPPFDGDIQVKNETKKSQKWNILAESQFFVVTKLKKNVFVVKLGRFATLTSHFSNVRL